MSGSGLLVARGVVLLPSAPGLFASLRGHFRALWGPLKHKLQVCSNLQGRVKQMPRLNRRQGSLPAEGGPRVWVISRLGALAASKA